MQQNKNNQLDVIYLDNHLLIINKAAGVLIQEDRTGDIDLLSLARRYIKDKFNKPGNVYLGLVHRLDRPVSGVVCFARTSKAASRLSAQFRQNRVKKRYVAIVEGHCEKSGTLRHYLLKEASRVRIVRPQHAKAKKAELNYRSLHNKKNTSLLDIDLLTGRPHQIRVQLAETGHPILGDLRYGARHVFDGKNLALHCFSLGFEHPVKKNWIQTVVQPPAVWQEYYKKEIDRIIDETGGEFENNRNRDENS
ncbi:RNA pseudouridine synthase [candidate division KSB1 bacterium]|nr:RNA pseudouridine synthase [candidate division KSB1 bacterium]